MTTVVAGTLLGLLLAAAYGLAAIVVGRLRPREQFALGPFLVLGTMTALLVG